MVVVLHHVEIGTFGLYPAGDYFVDAVICPFMGFPLDLACLRLT
jgi:hypothetical protein